MLHKKQPESGEKKILKLVYCFVFITVFLFAHHYLTNVVLENIDLNYRVFANALQFTLALLLFRYLFRSRQLRMVGSILFYLEILVTCITAYLASVESIRNKLFPEFVPLYLIINGILVFHILWTRRVRIALILPLLIIAVTYDIVVAPSLLKKSRDYAGKVFIGKKIHPFLSRSTCDSQTAVRQPKNCLVFATFLHCLPCRKMIPFEEEAFVRFKTASLDVIKLDLIDDWAEIVSVVNADSSRKGICTVVPFRDTTVKAALDRYGFPLILAVNREGEIIYAHAGYDPREYNLLIKELSHVITKMQ